MMRRTRLTGFTLFELLVVLSILPLCYLVIQQISDMAFTRTSSLTERQELSTSLAGVDSLLREDLRQTRDLPTVWGEFRASETCLVLAQADVSTIVYRLAPGDATRLPRLERLVAPADGGQVRATVPALKLHSCQFEVHPALPGGLPLVHWELTASNRQVHGTDTVTYSGQAAARSYPVPTPTPEPLPEPLPEEGQDVPPAEDASPSDAEGPQ